MLAVALLQYKCNIGHGQPTPGEGEYTHSRGVVPRDHGWHRGTQVSSYRGVIGYFTPAWEAERAASRRTLLIEGPTVGTVGRKLDGVFRRRPARLEVARLCGEACASRQALL